MRGHTDHVNAVKFFPTAPGQPQILSSGSGDKTIRIWRARTANTDVFDLVATLHGHERPVKCITVSEFTNVIVSGSADSTIKIWRLDVQEAGVTVELLQTIQTQPRFTPLSLALHRLPNSEDLVLAVAGTKNAVQVYASSRNSTFCHRATLTGHEDWIQAIAITKESPIKDGDLLLATASQDKYIRLWRITRRETKLNSTNGDVLATFEQTLSNKAHMLEASQCSYAITFEALLLGHDDWIYTLSWRLDDNQLRLLSASADNSIAIWQLEKSSGVWVCTTRLGEISAQKGSTTATGSTGGFWIGLWSPNGNTLVSLGRTGSWRLWNYDGNQDRWVQGTGISGHTKSVGDVAWSKEGSYLVSTGSDQTTRLHAAWKHGTKRSWHEMARPQIHGYVLNCIDSIGQIQIISGADEKLLRVFDEPRATAELLDQLCGIKTSCQAKLPVAANVPVLGLSNKAIEDVNEVEIEVIGDVVDEQASLDTSVTQELSVDQIHPPFEDQLARYTLWPEREKLYGHGYEISAVAASHDGSLVATSCRASSLDHAVIRIYETKDWRQIKPPLVAHSLTVTALCFSKDDLFLLSVGRDRQWVVFERDVNSHETYLLKHSNPKGHSRMILHAAWAPVEAGRVFATASRDKTVKVWSMSSTHAECMVTITASFPVTAVDIDSILLQECVIVAVGTETGEVGLYIVKIPARSIERELPLDTA